VNRLRRVHLSLGLLGLGAFLASGLYMHVRYDHLRGLADGPRLLFRSSHIYLLFSSLLNVLLGTYFVPGRTAWRRGLQCVGSALVAMGPFLFVIAFLREPWLHGLVRPFARWAIFASLAGVLLHLSGRPKIAPS
jgi:hypothetical protein